MVDTVNGYPSKLHFFFLCFRVNITSRNTHDIVFRTIEIGVALWFPCVLWNCIRPEQLWCLNPKKILERFPPLRDSKDTTNTKTIRQSPRNDSESSSSSTNSDGKFLIFKRWYQFRCRNYPLSIWLFLNFPFLAFLWSGKNTVFPQGAESKSELWSIFMSR